MKDWDRYVDIISNLIASRESYQRSLGEISCKVKKDFGSKALIDLAEDIKETNGRTISPKTLRNYAWVWDKTSDLNLPEDITYRAQQELAGTKDPEKWVKLLLDKGLSSAELVRMIRESKGLIKEKETKCPNCKGILKCPKCL